MSSNDFALLDLKNSCTLLVFQVFVSQLFYARYFYEKRRNLWIKYTILLLIIAAGKSYPKLSMIIKNSYKIRVKWTKTNLILSKKNIFYVIVDI